MGWPAAAAEAALALLGDGALGCEVDTGSWRLGLLVDAEGSRAAVAVAEVQVRAVAVLAGLPDWPVTSWWSRGEGERRDLGDGLTEIRHEMSSGTSVQAVWVSSEEDDE